MRRERGSPTVDLALGTGAAPQMGATEQRTQHHGQQGTIDISTGTGMHAVAPKNIIMPRPARPKAIGVLHLHRIKHGRIIGGQHHGARRDGHGAPSATGNGAVTNGPPIDNGVQGLITERLKHIPLKLTGLAVPCRHLGQGQLFGSVQ